MVNGYAYIGTKDVNFDSSINYDNGIKIPFESQKFKIAHRNSILLCIEGGSAGRKIAYLDQDVCFGNKLSTITSFIVNSKYIYYLLQSTLLFNFFKINITGIIGGVSINKLKTFIIPLPPLKEQQRIIEKYENLLPYICRYNNIYEQLEKINNNYKEDLKKSILQYAIQGKLVKQDSHDEPADILINKILDEKRELIKSKKIKKENLSVIYKDSKDNQFYEKFDNGTIKNITDEIPFEIPDTWQWSRLKSVCTKIVDGDHNPPPGQNTTTDYIMLSAKNIQNNKLVDIEQARYLTKINYEKGKSRIDLKDNDILLTIVGTIGRSCIYKDIHQNILFQRSVSVITTLINNIFLKSVFDCHYVQNKMISESTGTAQKGFYLKQLEKLLIPIPPQNEQEKIINKLNIILNKIETAE